MIKTVCILGNHIQALGLARQVKLLDIDVILFTNTHYSISRFSNAVKKTIFFKTEAEITKCLVQNISEEKDTLLFPTNDEMVNFLSENYNKFNTHYYLGIPQPEVVEIFYNKRNTYQFAEKNNIIHPKTWFPDSIADVENLSNKISFPIIIKPGIMHSFHKQFGEKAFRCNNSKELIEKASWISESFSVGNLVIQELLLGGPRNLYSYAAFAINGEVYASLMVNRIRQNPMDFGNSTTFARTCNIDEISTQAKKILSISKYFGMAEVEFMYDEKEKEYKFLEINTRAWKWHSISNILGFSFIEFLIRHFNHESIKSIHSIIENRAWAERLTDISVIIESCLRGEMSLHDVINSYKLEIEYAVWDKKDLKPFLMYLLLAPILYFKRH